jgi:uncharacterized membrane protein YeaQ/YmgE (transglycosylase-associated protein family)
MEGLLVLMIFVCGICGILGFVIGSQKCQGGLGAMLGILLGPLGVLIAALLSDQRGEGKPTTPPIGRRLRVNDDPPERRYRPYNQRRESTHAGKIEPTLAEIEEWLR